MKKIILLLASVSSLIFMGCEGPEGPQGPQGNDGYSAESEVFELRNVNFTRVSDNEYNIYYSFNQPILLSDNIIIYRLSDVIDSQTPVWQPIPRTLYLTQGELDYDYDFSKLDFYIYAKGTYNLSARPEYLYNQTFRIVIIPGYLSNKNSIDPHDMDYQTLIKTYKIDDRKVKVLP